MMGMFDARVRKTIGPDGSGPGVSETNDPSIAAGSFWFGAAHSCACSYGGPS